MKNGIDPDKMRELVRKGYDEGDYFEHYRKDQVIDNLEKWMLEEFMERVQSG